MQYTFVLAALASMATAQTLTSSAASSSSSSACAAQIILDACIATIQGQVNSCSTTDYSCLCNNYQNLLTCYSNCPADPAVSSVQQQHQQYCSAASVYGSTTTYGTAPATSGAASTTATGSSSETAVQTGFASATDSGASTSASSSSDNGAASLEIAGGALAIVAAGFGLLL